MTINKIYTYAKLNPHTPAIIHNDQPVTYAEFAKVIGATRRFFAAEQLASGKIALILIADQVAAWAALIALRSLGVTTTCAPTITSAEKLSLRNVGCIIAAEAEWQEPDLESTEFARVPLVRIPTAVFHEAQHENLPHSLEQSTCLGGHILHTSGTTGEYKKILLDGAYEDARNKLRPGLKYSEHPIVHMFDFGLWTALGFRVPLAFWDAGGCVIFDLTPGKFNKFFGYKVEYGTCIEVYLQKLVVAREGLELGRHRFSEDLDLFFGGGFLPLSLAEATVDRITPNLRVVYGSTELKDAKFEAVFRTADDLVWLSPLPDQPFEIVDERDDLCAIDEEGALRFPLQPGDAQGYLDDEIATQRFFRNGCFYSGDLAVQRSDGKVRILGRDTDVISVGGAKKAVAPLEQNIQERLGVPTVCAFSIQRESGDSDVFIAVEADTPPTLELLTRVHSELSEYISPKFFCLPKFPRTTTGMAKVNRRELRRILLDSKPIQLPDQS